MNIHDALFWFFSIAMLVCGFLVIANRNPVASALFLVLLFVFMAGLFLVLAAFFIFAFPVLCFWGAVFCVFFVVILFLCIMTYEGAEIKDFRVSARSGGVPA